MSHMLHISKMSSDPCHECHIWRTLRVETPIEKHKSPTNFQITDKLKQGHMGSTPLDTAYGPTCETNEISEMSSVVTDE